MPRFVHPQLDLQRLNPANTEAPTRFHLTPRPITTHITEPQRDAPSYSRADERFVTTNQALEGNQA